jgi:hypothetical protein
MKMKIGDVLIYRDCGVSVRYGTGVVTSITPDEYTILWSGRGLTRYRRSILDERTEEVFERVERGAGLPKERHLHLSSSKSAVPFNENYDRAKVELLCEKMKTSGLVNARDVADGLTAELFTKKWALRGTARAVLKQLADLCNTRNSPACDEARSISKELFFGYVIQKSDFSEVGAEK